MLIIFKLNFKLYLNYLIIFLNFIIWSNLIYAQNFGVQGEVFQIKEQNLIHAMQNRLVQLDKAGYFAKLNLALENQARAIVGTSNNNLEKNNLKNNLQNNTQNKHGHIINPLTDICLECFYPITIGRTKIIKSKRSPPDTENPHNPFCHCGHHIGIAAGYWEPVAVVDVTTHPYFMVNLGGLTLPNVFNRSEGSVAHYATSNNHSFYYFHYAAFPGSALLPFKLDGACKNEGKLGLAFLSETDPNWIKETTQNSYPELIPVLKNILKSQTLQAADCVAANTHLPLENIFWNCGCQGSLYPISGTVSAHVSSVQAATLIAERGTLLLHRLGFMQDSGKHCLCSEKYSAYLPKSRYRYQMIYPKKQDCYQFGHTTASWESNILKYDSSEDYGYIIWKKKNCCVY